MAPRARVRPRWVGPWWIVAHGWVGAWRRVETWRHVGAICIHMGGDEAGLRHWVTRWLIGWGADVCGGHGHARRGLHHSWRGAAWGRWGSALLLQKGGCGASRIWRGWLVRHLCGFWTSNPRCSEGRGSFHGRPRWTRRALGSRDLATKGALRLVSH